MAQAKPWILALLVAWPVLVQGQEPVDPANSPTVEEEYAQGYNAFRDTIDKGMRRLTERLTRQYELAEEQQGAISRKLQNHVNEFFDSNGSQAYDLYRKGQALAEYMKENKVSFQEIDAEIIQDLANDALPLFDSYIEQTRQFSEDIKADLDGRQQALLERDMMQMEIGVRAGRMQLMRMAGRETPSTQPGDAGAGPGFGKPRDYRSEWRKYVDAFCDRNALDEVQKHRAYAILDEHLARLEIMQNQPLAGPAQPAVGVSASQPQQDVTQFREKLQASRAGEARGIFQEMVKQLEMIPSPAQKRLAEQSQKPEPPTEPEPPSRAQE